MSMADYIMSILKTQLFIVFSWGFHNARAIENGLQFNVQGFLFTGRVRVIYNGGSDTFTVKLLNPDGTTKEEHTDVYLDNLVDVIDGAVEKNEPQEAYAERVNAEYNLYY